MTAASPLTALCGHEHRCVIPSDNVSTDQPRTAAGDLVTLSLDGWAHGGEAVGRLPEGMACFVAHALPGETVTARISEKKKRWARAELVEVLEASPHRVDPPCPYYGPDRCGGCQLQHAAPPHQLELKARVLREQLIRIGRVEDPPAIVVDPVPDAWPQGYRAWARMAVAPDGALGFRRAGSHDVHPIDHCLLMTDDAADLREDAGDGWTGVDEVGLMAGTDGRLLTIHPGTGGVPAAPEGSFGVALQATGAPAVLREPGAVTMRVHDVDLRVSAGAFFQAGPAAAAALVDLVVAAASPADPIDLTGMHVLDLYGGVGLFSAFLARAGARVTLVESSEQATADARDNLADLDVTVVTADVADVMDELADVDVVVLDPPRSGAGPDVCRELAALRPDRLVYVACDPAALARDTKALLAEGMQLASVQGLDVFGHTAHVEAVATFLPVSGAAIDDSTAGAEGQ